MVVALAKMEVIWEEWLPLTYRVLLHKLHLRVSVRPVLTQKQRLIVISVVLKNSSRNP